jgi:hypothetical protein
MNNIFLSPDNRQNDKKIKEFIKKLGDEQLTIKRGLDDYVLQQLPNLEWEHCSESGYKNDNKVVRYRAQGIWDYDYKCIPLYNRNSENPFSDQALRRISATIINYFRINYDFRLILKLKTRDYMWNQLLSEY